MKTQTNLIWIPATLLILGLSLGGCASQSQLAVSERDHARQSAASQVEKSNPAPVSDHTENSDQAHPMTGDGINGDDDETVATADILNNDAQKSLGSQSDDSETSTVNEVSNDETPDMWERIRQGFTLSDQQNIRIVKEIDWFARHQDYLDRVAQRAKPYLHYIVNEVERRGIPSEIALLPVVESAFQPYAYSPGRAAGIWQFIPGTGRRYGLKLNWWYDGRRDIAASTQAALDYLQYLHDTFDGDWLLALAAYNSGEGTVMKAMRVNQHRHKPTDFWSLQLPRETEQYVPRLLAMRNIVADPNKQGVTLLPIADEPYLTAVKIDSQLDLATAAKLAEMDLDELYQLNPGFNRWATAPDGPHRLLLPLDKAATFATNLAELAPEEWVQWVRHRVHTGETLSHIAVRYKTTVAVLMQLNNLKNHSLRQGQYLIIPVANETTAADNGDNGEQNNANTDNQAIDKVIHNVAPGDSLWVLAHRHGTTIRQLQAWNGLKDGQYLRTGQQIIVGMGSAKNDAMIAPSMLTMPDEIAKPRKITYIVRRGDSLSRISQRFKVSIQQVKKWNDLKNGQYLRPGQQLTLYVPLTADSERG